MAKEAGGKSMNISDIKFTCFRCDKEPEMVLKEKDKESHFYLECPNCHYMVFGFNNPIEINIYVFDFLLCNHGSTTPSLFLTGGNGTVKSPYNFICHYCNGGVNGIRR